MPNKERLLRPARVFDHHGTVPPGPTKDVLLQGLEGAGTSFERGELAYLAVTSKVEFAVATASPGSFTEDLRIAAF